VSGPDDTNDRRDQVAAPDPLEVARRVADALEQAGVPHAIGGAIAYAYWGVPRATRDVDVKLFVTSGGLDPALRALRSAGVAVSEEDVRSSAAERGDAKVYDGDVRIDLFVNSIPFHDAAARGTKTVDLAGRPAQVLSAEDLAVFKLLFFRSKDTVDLEALVAVRRDTLDASYIRQWLVDTVGEDDERVRYWDALWTELG